MRVRYCYVFGFGALSAPIDVETAAVSQGLYDRAKSRCGSAALIHWDTNSKLVDLAGGIPITDFDTLETVKEGFPHEVGAYLVLHTKTGYSFVENSVIIKALRHFIPVHVLAKLAKVSMVACHSAALAQGTNADIAGRSLADLASGKGEERSVLLNLLLALNAEGITPMLAGWDDFVTAAPHRPTVGGKSKSVYPTPKKTGTPFTDEQLKSSDLIGKKIVHGNRYGFATPEFRGQHKRVYWVQDGTLQIDGQSGWSDKD